MAGLLPRYGIPVPAPPRKGTMWPRQISTTESSSRTEGPSKTACRYGPGTGGASSTRPRKGLRMMRIFSFSQSAGAIGSGTSATISGGLAEMPCRTSDSRKLWFSVSPWLVPQGPFCHGRTKSFPSGRCKRGRLRTREKRSKLTIWGRLECSPARPHSICASLRPPTELRVPVRRHAPESCKRWPKLPGRFAVHRKVQFAEPRA